MHPLFHLPFYYPEEGCGGAETSASQHRAQSRDTQQAGCQPNNLIFYINILTPGIPSFMLRAHLSTELDKCLLKMDYTVSSITQNQPKKLALHQKRTVRAEPETVNANSHKLAAKTNKLLSPEQFAIFVPRHGWYFNEIYLKCV